MKPLPQTIDEERDRQQAEKLRRVTLEAEAYWNETAPCGALPVKAFTLADGIELLLYDLRRYQAAVARIFEKEQEQKALLDHKAVTRSKRASFAPLLANVYLHSTLIEDRFALGAHTCAVPAARGCLIVLIALNCSQASALAW